MKKTLLFLAMAFLLPNVYFFSSCGGDDDDDAPANITNVEKNTGNPLKSNDSTAFNVDPDYRPASIELQKKWTGSYEGWDAVQKSNTKIIRELTLTTSGTYTNVI